MIGIATGFIPLSQLSVVSTMVIWESSYCLKELQESMDSCTGCFDKTEILLKNGVKHKTINHSTYCFLVCQSVRLSQT